MGFAEDMAREHSTPGDYVHTLVFTNASTGIGEMRTFLGLVQYDRGSIDHPEVTISELYHEYLELLVVDKVEGDFIDWLVEKPEFEEATVEIEHVEFIS
jgi:hypothetical protein